MPRPAVHIVTLGCPKNEVDSDRMAARLAGAGADVASDLDTAEVAVVNTCAFITAATEESLATVLELAGDWKAARPGRFLVVAGCLATRYAADLAAELPEVDAFVPVADEDRIAAVVETLLGSWPRLDAAVGPPVEAGTRTLGAPSAYVSIAEGCHRRCTYCTIPFIRGGYASRPAADILAEARLLVAGGARELVLVGQDTSSYGRGMPAGAPPAELPKLVRTLATEVDDLAWLRLMYVQPDGVTDALLEAMAASPVVCRYLDIPMQHASERVLRAMGRRGDGTAFLELLGRIRTVMPDVRLRTTLIAGFPGETEEDVDVLASFVKEACFDYAGVFPYSPEEGTPAAALPGRVPRAERVRRAQRVIDAAEAIGVARVAELVESVLEVLVEGHDPDAPFGPPDVGAWSCRWRGQAPEVDGGVFIDRDLQPGTIVPVRIVESLGYDLYGEVA